MLFNSPVFIFAFFPITLVIFYLAAQFRGARLAQIWLILASLFFYGYWNPAYLPLIVGSMAFNYAMGLLLSNCSHKAADRRATLYLSLGVCANLALLGFFKYANFFVANVDTAFDAGWTLQKIILPIGISFFTFQQIAYLVDARRGKTREHDLLQYCLFVVFFPQLIAGPIVHHKEMLPQFRDNSVYRPNLDNLSIGLTIFIIGLFKKLVIADNLATIATPVFTAADHGSTLHFFQAWQGALSYTFQIYFDFSGYSDMAIGLGRCFGIRLPLNFHSPYQAINIIDFWRRWHMTLSRFLRDYLYIPLGGNRHGKTRRYANLMITMLLGGLWHGAGWTFVIWGGLHGIYLVINHAWHCLSARKGVGSPDNILGRTSARLVTFFAVVVAWVFFRAESFSGAMAIFKGMINLPHTLQGRIGVLEPVLAGMGFRFDGPYISQADMTSVIWLAVLLGIVWVLPNTQQFMAKAHPAYDFKGDPDSDAMPATSLSASASQIFRWNHRLLWAMWVGILGFASLASLNRVSEFLYFQF